MQDTLSNMRNNRIRKDKDANSRKCEKSALHYDLVTTEETGHRLEGILRSPVAPLQTGRENIEIRY